MFRSLTALILIIFLATSNILLITSASFFSTAADFIDKLPVNGLMNNSYKNKYVNLKKKHELVRKENVRLSKEVNHYKTYNTRLKTRLRHTKHQAGSIARRIMKRVARNITANIGAMVGEATPYAGVTVVVATTAMDINDGCESIKDMNNLLSVAGEKKDIEVENKVCGISIPDAREIIRKIQHDVGGVIHQSKVNVEAWIRKTEDRIGGTIALSKERVEGGAKRMYESIGGAIHAIFN